MVLWFDGGMRRFWLYLPSVLVAATIFWLSSRSVLPYGVSLPSPWDKLAHASAFGVLALTLELEFRHWSGGFPLHRRHLWIFVAVSLFGATDEFHQRFVPGRECDVLDWMADSMGAVIALSASCIPMLYGRHLAGLSWWRGRRERPDAGRPLMLVADPHWNEELTGLREAALAHPEADWLFLGDVFDVWVGFPSMQNEAQRSFLWWVQERRAAGRWVGLWGGNRDYFLDALKDRFDFIGEGIGGELPAEGLVFEHGDLINGADRRYRLWNLISRSGPLWLLMSLLPPRLAQALSRKLERSLRTTNRTHKQSFPREAFRAASTLHPDKTFVVGHFHTHEVEANGIALPWAHEGVFAQWSQGRLEVLPTFVRTPAEQAPEELRWTSTPDAIH